MRRRLMTILILALGLTLLTAQASMAASPHFKKGGEPVCTFSGTTSIPVTCSGTLAGLGNQDLKPSPVRERVRALPVLEWRRQHRAWPEQGAGGPGRVGHGSSG
jgi:hypothetical protein